MLTALNLGALNLCHRVVMPGSGWSPEGEIRPPPKPATYACRATPGGLVISHPLAVSARGRFHPACPSGPDLCRWQAIAATIRGEGGLAVAQLAHAGRLAHSSVIGMRPLGPDTIAAHCDVFDAEGRRCRAEPPEALAPAGLDAVLAEFGEAAHIARQAGFDALELNAAEGGLLDQFLQDGSNRRPDAYGGDRDGRMAFVLEVLETLIAIWGADRVGVRLSPMSTLNGMGDSAPIDLFVGVLRALSDRDIAFVHFSGTGPRPGPHVYGEEGARLLRAAIAWPLILSGPFAPIDAMAAVDGRWADAIGFDGIAAGITLLAGIRAAADR